MNDQTYNGWANRATWNVALWLGNDEGLYRLTVAYADQCRADGVTPAYADFLRYAGLAGAGTPDGYLYGDAAVNGPELSEMLAEHASC